METLLCNNMVPEVGIDPAHLAVLDFEAKVTIPLSRLCDPSLRLLENIVQIT